MDDTLQLHSKKILKSFDQRNKILLVDVSYARGQSELQIAAGKFEIESWCRVTIARNTSRRNGVSFSWHEHFLGLNLVIFLVEFW